MSYLRILQGLPSPVAGARQRTGRGKETPKGTERAGLGVGVCDDGNPKSLTCKLNTVCQQDPFSSGL